MKMMIVTALFALRPVTRMVAVLAAAGVARGVWPRSHPDGGGRDHGDWPGIRLRREGNPDVQIGNRTYTGTWVAAQGGSVGFGTAGRTSFNAMAVDASSAGNAMLRSADGSTLRCQFVFGGMSGTGYGECRDNAGPHYDLQII